MDNLVAHINIPIVGYGLSLGYSIKLITALFVCLAITACKFFFARLSKQANGDRCNQYLFHSNKFTVKKSISPNAA